MIRLDKVNSWLNKIPTHASYEVSQPSVSKKFTAQDKESLKKNYESFFDEKPEPASDHFEVVIENENVQLQEEESKIVEIGDSGE